MEIIKQTFPSTTPLNHNGCQQGEICIYLQYWHSNAGVKQQLSNLIHISLTRREIMVSLLELVRPVVLRKESATTTMQDQHKFILDSRFLSLCSLIIVDANSHQLTGNRGQYFVISPAPHYNYITSTSWLVEHCGIWEKKDSINENTRKVDMKILSPGNCCIHKT